MSQRLVDNSVDVGTEAIGVDGGQMPEAFDQGRRASSLPWQSPELGHRLPISRDGQPAHLPGRGVRPLRRGSGDLEFGWVVEVDPTDPDSTPVKRTAPGRMKHEAANVVLSRNRRVVVHMGDDERFEDAYKYASDGRYAAGTKPGPPRPGCSTPARCTWPASTTGAEASGSRCATTTPGLKGTSESRAALLIRTREAADLVGAETDPATGGVHFVLTATPARPETSPADRPGTGVDAANPRADNRFGHILELREDGDDPAAHPILLEHLLARRAPQSLHPTPRRLPARPGQRHRRA